MSRIGKLPIVIPDGVKLNYSENVLKIEGPKGQTSIKLVDNIRLKIDNDSKKVLVERNLEKEEDEKIGNSIHGLFRVLINNLLIGVVNGFEKRLEIVGTGFKANVEGGNLILNVGFSHPVKYKIPQGIKVTVEENTKIVVNGIDKHLVGHVASEIRKVRPPEPYKGKGIKYVDEKIKRKAGKSAKKKWKIYKV